MYYIHQIFTSDNVIKPVSYRGSMAGETDFDGNTWTFLHCHIVILPSLMLAIFETKIGGHACNLLYLVLKKIYVKRWLHRTNWMVLFDFTLLLFFQTAMDQLHMHFTQAIHNTVFQVVLGYVELCAGNTDTKFQKLQYKDLCTVCNSCIYVYFF